MIITYMQYGNTYGDASIPSIEFDQRTASRKRLIITFIACRSGNEVVH